MKKNVLICLLALCLLAGCGGEKTEETVGLANPWVAYSSLEKAEAAVGFDFPLPETVADSYRAESFRVMNDQMIEVTYRDDTTLEVTVRQQAGEGQDISGDYRTYEDVRTAEGDGWTNTTKFGYGGVLQLVSCGGYSYSLHAPSGYWGDSNGDFLRYLYS